MGPILKRVAQKKKQQSSKLYTPTAPPFSLPYDLPQLGLFYADLLGERMGTAAGV